MLEMQTDLIERRNIVSIAINYIDEEIKNIEAFDTIDTFILNYNHKIN